METTSDFDLQTFQEDVLKTVDILQQEQSSEDIALGSAVIGAAIGNVIFTGAVPALIPGLGVLIGRAVAVKAIKEARKVQAHKTEQAQQVAEKVVQKRDFKKHLCPMLQSITDDVYDIAKTITPILVPLVLAKTINIPLEPLYFATLALVIARMSVEGVCAEYDKQPQDEEKSKD